MTAVAYMAVLIAMAFAAARHSVSNFYAQSAFRSGSETEAAAAVRFHADNPEAHEVRGMVLLRAKDFAAAADAFRKAAALRPVDYLLRLRLGYALSRSGDLAAAEIAYRHAIELAPRYSRPRAQLGKMYLESGEREKAFEFLSDAARLDPSYYPEVLHHARVAFADDPKAIEKAVAAVSPEAKAIVARYLIKRHWMTEDVRSFLLSDELSSAEKNDFIGYLKYKRNFTLAREVWRSRTGMDDTDDEPLFDGGFDRIAESDPSGLGWQIDPKISAVALARDSTDVHSGEGSLNVRFSGNVELQRPIVSQLAYVTPGRKYTLSFFARSTETVSAGLPAVIISDVPSNKTIASSEPLADTKGAWTRYEVTFTAPNAQVVLISLQRPACTESPCPIFGELSLDQISIK